MLRNGWMRVGIFLMACAVAWADPGTNPTPGNGSGGGGNTLRSQSYWRVADSAYHAPQYTRFVFPPELNAVFADMSDAAYTLKLGSAWYDAVYNQHVEFRLVDKLPGNCHFVDDDSIAAAPGEEIVHVGCTFGFVTYLLKPAVQEAIDTKNYLELALLMVHERLFPYSHYQESYEIISEYVQGLRLVMLRYVPAAKHAAAALNNLPKVDPNADWVKNPPRLFSDEELEIVNNMPERFRQLSGDAQATGKDDYTVNAYGGLSRYSDIDRDTALGLGTVLERVTLHGKGIVVVGHRGESFSLHGDRIRLLGGTTEFHVGVGFSGNDILILNSHLRNASVTANDFSSIDSDWDTIASIFDIGRFVTVRNSTIESVSYMCNEYTKPDHKFVGQPGWLGSLLKADHTTIENKVIDANCNVRDRD